MYVSIRLCIHLSICLSIYPFIYLCTRMYIFLCMYIYTWIYIKNLTYIYVFLIEYICQEENLDSLDVVYQESYMHLCMYIKKRCSILFFIYIYNLSHLQAHFLKLFQSSKTKLVDFFCHVSVKGPYQLELWALERSSKNAAAGDIGW